VAGQNKRAICYRRYSISLIPLNYTYKISLKNEIELKYLNDFRQFQNKCLFINKK
jgi:hypothetical protein